ncbi:MAG: methionine adenosyltransferase [Thaumarchaeota archaeon]|nr:methionine adenosyltransferase [Nitrososphaerota archaeon]
MVENRNIHVESLGERALSDYDLEIVERKGKGHPDSLIDGASEAVSRALCKYYLQEYGTILHHNVDKGILVGGRSNPRFGGGDVVDPIYIMVAGRAASFVEKDGKVYQVPTGGIAVSAIKNFLKETMRYLDTEMHLIVDFKIRQGSTDLMGVFQDTSAIPLANDTSIGVGYAPLSPTERLALETEKMLNSKKLKSELPEVGEDIKVMSLRTGNKVNLTVAAAMISSLTRDASHYQSVVEETKKMVEDLASKITTDDVAVRVNSGDSYSKGIYYLTVTGTSAESGDDGNTGRGNRPNGLITSMRQYSMEATAGKNPVNHTGKIYNVLAQKASDRIYSEVKGVREVYVRMLSRIGIPIDHPQVASAGLVLEKEVPLSKVKGDIESILNDELSRITQITPLITSGSVVLF